MKFAKHRARNSLSRKKFLDRLNKGLPIFVVHGNENSVDRYEECRDLHDSQYVPGSLFIYVTRYFPSIAAKISVSLADMNVIRNTYNHNFVFRTRWAAEQWLQFRRTN